MINKVKELSVIQNISLIDRLVRVSIGTALIVTAAISLGNNLVISWETYTILLAIYPLLTAILGWDPIYSLTHSSSCSLNGINQCGTIPYEIDSLRGNNPLPDKGHEFEHSLSASHHNKIQPFLQL